MRIVTFPRLCVAVGVVITTTIAAASPALGVGSASPNFAGYEVGPSTPTPDVAHVKFSVPTIICPGVPGAPSSVLVGDAVGDYPFTTALGATWGGIVLKCTATPAGGWKASYTAEGFQWTSTGGLVTKVLFTVAASQVVAVTSELNKVTVKDVTAGRSSTAKFAVAVGAGDAAIGFFCPASTWYPSGGPPCMASPKFPKIGLSDALIDGKALGASSSSAHYLPSPVRRPRESPRAILVAGDEAITQLGSPKSRSPRLRPGPQRRIVAMRFRWLWFQRVVYTPVGSE